MAGETGDLPPIKINGTTVIRIKNPDPVREKLRSTPIMLNEEFAPFRRYLEGRRTIKIAKPPKSRISLSKDTSISSESLTRETKIGETREGSPQIFFNDAVYKDIADHFREDLSRERGGLLIGYIRQNGAVEVTGFLPAIPDSETSAIRFQFAAENWSNFNIDIERRGKGEVRVGWAHSHPDIEPAFSPFDVDAMTFFNMPGQFGLVIDPVNDALGIFRLKDGQSVNEGGIVLKGNLPNNGLDQIPRLTTFNSLAEAFRSSVKTSDIKTGRIKVAPKITVVK